MNMNILIQRLKSGTTETREFNGSSVQIPVAPTSLMLQAARSLEKLLQAINARDITITNLMQERDKLYAEIEHLQSAKSAGSAFSVEPSASDA